MSNWKDVKINNRTIRVNSIKWWAWEDLVQSKEVNDRISMQKVLKACLSPEDWQFWTDIDFDPPNTALGKEREEAINALMEMNPKLFPNYEASKQTTLSAGTPSTGSPKNSDGQ